MKKLLLFLALLQFTHTQAQTIMGRQRVDQFTISSSGTLTYGLTWLPLTYSNTSRRYPLIIALHGIGEVGSTQGDLARLYSAYPRAASGRIADGWNADAVNPLTGKTDSFIVVSPQAPYWSYSYNELKYILPSILSKYRVDSSMIYLTGLSAGGDGVFTTFGSRDTAFIKMFAAVAAANGAGVSAANGYSETQVEDGIRYASNYGVKMWTIASENDQFLTYNLMYHNYSNSFNPKPANKLTVIAGVGHAAWDNAYNPSFRPTVNFYGNNGNCNNGCAAGGINMAPNSNGSSVTGSGVTQDSLNLYEWFLASKRPSKTTTTTPPPTTTYSFPRIAAGADQTITLPTSSANVTSSSVVTGASVVSTNWYKLKTPGQASKKVVWIGSSTTAGTGATTEDSAVYYRFYNWGVKNGLISNTSSAASCNLGVVGTSVFAAMPTGYVPTGSQVSPDPLHNVTAALALNPDIVIVNFPTNNYDVQSVSEIMMAFRTIYNTVTALGKQCYITTTQPRIDFLTAAQLKLQTIRDSILTAFGSNAINFYDGMVNTGTTSFIPEYAYGDGIHFNDLGHRMLFEQVVARNIFAPYQSSSASITSSASSNTSITGLTAGTHTFQVTVKDSHGQNASAFTTITVNPGAATASANAGADQTITLPVSAVTLNGSSSSGTITSYAWSRVSGPNNPTIVSPSSASTSVTGLIQGTYIFQLSVNNGASTDMMTVTVNPAAVSSSCSGKAYNPIPGQDSGYWNNFNLLPGDTLFIDGSKAWSYVYVYGKSGTPSCPIVIMNKNGQVKMSGNTAQLTIRDCQYIKVLGTGTPGVQYGFHIQPYPTGMLVNGQFAMSIDGRSKNVEVSNVSISHAGIGMNVKEDGGCDPQYNYPNWVIDSVFIHHNKIVKTWNQGMYIGNTSPDNGPSSYDVRPVDCNGVTTYPRPVRMGNIKVYQNIVDSTGRAGIQMASASTGLSEIYNNTITHSGIGGDEQQGAGINLGTYTNVWVYGNSIKNTYTYGISSFGASSTGNTLKIENNVIDSSGYMNHYGFGDWSTDIIQFATRQVSSNNLTWPYSIAIYTKPTESPVDSTRFYVSGNALGRRKNSAGGIVVGDYQNTFHKSGNYICNNTVLAGGSTTVIVEEPYIPVYFSATCSGQTNNNPVANAGTNQTITLPVNSVTLSGSGTDADGTIASYNWTKQSGPSAGTITNPSSASTTVTGLVQGTYQFTLTVTDNNGATGSATVQITVNAAANQAPVANAGTNQTITLPTNTVTLTGSGTDADGTINSYNWTKLSGPSSGTISNATSANTNVTGLTQGTYQFQLTVTDNSGATGNATVQVIVNSAANQAPVANAGTNQTITLPTSTVTLTGSGTDADGTINSYNWTKLSGPSSGTISNATSANTTVTGLTQGTYQFQLTVTDNSGATGNATVQVIVNSAANQAPVANAGTNQTITLPTSTVTLSGSGTDADGTISSYNWTKISGPSSGTISNATSANTNVTGLTQGTYQFQLTVTDNSGATGNATVQVIVNSAANQAPVANAGTDQTITLPVNSVTLSGSGTDADGTIMSYHWVKISGPASGTISDMISATTTVTGLVQGTYQFLLTVTDNSGASSNDAVQIIVNAAANQAPLANAGSNQTITLPTNSVTLTGSGTDADGTISSYNWTKLIGPSSGTISNSSSATTTVTGLVQGTYQFLLTVTDNNGATGGATVQITVNAAANQAPVAIAGTNQTITLPVNSVTLSGSGTDADGTIVSYHWIKLSGPAAGTITNLASATTTVTGLVQGTYQFLLTVTDNSGASGNDVVQVTVNSAANLAPVANAGTNQTITLPTNTVTLNGSGTDADGTISSYNWTKLSGPSSVTISSSSSASTTVTGLVQGTYQFLLTITDNNGATGSAIVDIIVNAAANIAPVVNAGSNQTITLPANSVTLSGSATDADGTISGYHWIKLSGPASGTITNMLSATTTVTGLVQGTYQFLLTATDNSGASGNDAVQITVNAAANLAPVANAGSNQTITLPTNTVTLDGSGTDADGTINSYSWIKLSGPASGTISNPSSAHATVTGLVQGTYQFTLTVTDNSGATGSDIVQITVNPAANVAPVANAGSNQTITLPASTVTLNGSGTDADGTISSYNWTKLSGPASGTISSPSSASTTVTGLAQGTYQFTLTVTDNDGASSSDVVQVTVNAANNQAPVANAGTNQTITLPTNTVTLSGSGTDADGTISSYNWTKLSGPASGSISSSSSASTTVTGLVQGTYQFLLTVTDNKGATGSATVQIVVNAAANQPPVANAGANQTIVLPTNSVTLNGTGTDADGTIASYSWTKLSGHSSGTISTPSSATTIITGLVKGISQFILTVTDNNGAIGKDTVDIIVQESAVVVTTTLITSTKLYPNPAKNSTNLEVTTNNTNENWLFVKIYSLNGLLVYSKQIQRTDAKTTLPIDVSKLQAGSYFVYVNCGPTSKTVLKLIKR